MPSNWKWRSGAFGALLVVAAAPAAAQVIAEGMELEQVRTVIGAGVGMVPDYKGSDDQKGALAPFFRYTWDQARYVQLAGNELSLNLIASPNFRLGPIAAFNPERDDVDDKVVEDMKDLDSSVEIGLFGDVVWPDPGNPRNRFIAGLAAFRDSESDGNRVRLSGRWWQQVSPTVDLHLGAGVIWTDDDYTDHYFGVNPGNVGTSGLPNFDAEGGVNEVYLTAGGLMQINREWRALALLRVGKLQGDAKDSPLVDDRGDSTQVSFVIGAVYSWR